MNTATHRTMVASSTWAKVGLLVGIAALGLVAEQAQAADKVRVGVATVYGPFAPLFAAQELGFFKERDLEVENTTYRGGGASQEAMAAGAADVVTNSPMGAALAISKGVKQKVVAAVATATPQGWFIVVPKDSPIQTIADLKGKTVGVTAKGSTTDFFALWTAKHANITFRTVPLGGAGLLPSLKNKQVDAVVLFPNIGYAALNEGSYRSVADLAKLMGPIVPDTIVASEDMINNRPDVLKRYLQALTKTVAYMKANEAWSKAFIKRYTEEPSDAVVEASYRDLMADTRTDGDIKPEWVQASLELMKLVPGAGTVPTIDAVFTNRFLPIRQD